MKPRPFNFPASHLTNVGYVMPGGALLLISARELAGERRTNLSPGKEGGIRIIGQRVATALADAIRQKSGGGVPGGWES